MSEKEYQPKPLEQYSGLLYFRQIGRNFRDLLSGDYHQVHQSVNTLDNELDRLTCSLYVGVHSGIKNFVASTLLFEAFSLTYLPLKIANSLKINKAKRLVANDQKDILYPHDDIVNLIQSDRLAANGFNLSPVEIDRRSKQLVGKIHLPSLADYSNPEVFLNAKNFLIQLEQSFQMIGEDSISTIVAGRRNEWVKDLQEQLLFEAAFVDHDISDNEVHSDPSFLVNEISGVGILTILGSDNTTIDNYCNISLAREQNQQTIERTFALLRENPFNPWGAYYFSQIIEYLREPHRIGKFIEDSRLDADLLITVIGANFTNTRAVSNLINAFQIVYKNRSSDLTDLGISYLHAASDSMEQIYLSTYINTAGGINRIMLEPFCLSTITQYVDFLKSLNSVGVDLNDKRFADLFVKAVKKTIRSQIGLSVDSRTKEEVFHLVNGIGFLPGITQDIYFQIRDYYKFITAYNNTVNQVGANYLSN